MINDAIESVDGQVTQLYDYMADQNKEINKVLTDAGIDPHKKDTKKKTSTKSTKKPVIKGSYKDLQQQLTNYQDDVQSGRVQVTPEEYQQKVTQMKANIEAKAIELGIEPDFDSIEGLQKQINTLKTNLRRGLVATVKVNEVRQTISDLEDELEEKEVELHMKPARSSLEGLRAQLSKIQKEMQSGWLDISPDQYKQVVDRLNGQIEQEEIRLNIKTDPIKDLRDQYNEIQNAPGHQNSRFQNAQLHAETTTNEHIMEIVEIKTEIQDNSAELDRLKGLREELTKDEAAFQAMGEEGQRQLAELDAQIAELTEKDINLHVKLDKKTNSEDFARELSVIEVRMNNNDETLDSLTKLRKEAEKLMETFQNAGNLEGLEKMKSLIEDIDGSVAQLNITQTEHAERVEEVTKKLKKQEN